MILKNFIDEYLGTAIVHVTAEDDCMLITGTDKRTRAEQCLINNGIHPDDAPIVLQTLGYILLDKELYPEGV